MSKYKYRIIMKDAITEELIKSINAYTSRERAEKACDICNAKYRHHNIYGLVKYEVDWNW